MKELSTEFKVMMTLCIIALCFVLKEISKEPCEECLHFYKDQVLENYPAKGYTSTIQLIGNSRVTLEYTGHGLASPVINRVNCITLLNQIEQ